jgi:Cu(I)/Ag(I) efflux system membrane protein CusA/SilA
MIDSLRALVWDLTETLIVLLSLPFALVGGLWLMWWMGFNLSAAVAVGFIALAALAAETGVIMLIYLDHAWVAQMRKAEAAGRAITPAARFARDRWRQVGALQDLRDRQG